HLPCVPTYQSCEDFRSPTCILSSHSVLHPIVTRCPPRQELFRCISHPFATLLGVAPFRVRLACVRHAASVQSEPGSNSSIQILINRYAIARALRFTAEPTTHSKSLQR